MKPNDRIMEKFNTALHGRELWIELKRINQIDENWILILFPVDDSNLINAALKELPLYMRRKYLNSALLIGDNNNVVIDEISVEGLNVLSKHISPEDIESILSYYRLQQFFKNIVVVSLNEPFGSDALIGKKGITIDDYVRDAIFV